MLKTLIEKELKAILLSPKFATVFAVCSILIVLSIYIGIEEYKAAAAHYEAVSSGNKRQIQDERVMMLLRTDVIRQPDPMQIFISGISNDIGRQSKISGNGIKLYNSNYSENTIFAVFRSMDLMFIMQIILSLFAILFTYDAISGERESGTLKLSFANQLPRTRYIIAKLAGSWAGLVIPLLIPLTLGIMLVLIFNIPMTFEHWVRFFLLIGVSFLYLTFFICLGVLFSALTRESSGSFLLLLVIWVSSVLILPRAGVMTAGRFISVPSSAEIASALYQKNRELNKRHNEWMQDYAREFTSGRGNGIARFLDDMKEKREKLDQDRAAYDAVINENWRNRKAVREKLGFSLSRLSPASAYQIAAMNLAGTGIGLKNSYEDQIRRYSEIFNGFRNRKISEAGINAYMAVSDPVDISEVPEFKFINQDSGRVLESVITDIGILLFFNLAAMAGTFIAFNRYDVR